MKQITNKTILKQGDKIYNPVEVDSVVYWIDETILTGMKGDWVIETHNPIVTTVCEISRDNADLKMNGYKDMKIIAQSQSKLDGVPVIDFNDFVNENGELAYTQKDIEKAIELAQRFNLVDGFSEPKYEKEEILEQINSISIIEVDEQFNVISYE